MREGGREGGSQGASEGASEGARGSEWERVGARERVGAGEGGRRAGVDNVQVVHPKEVFGVYMLASRRK
jgi:hypothetical protein